MLTITFEDGREYGIPAGDDIAAVHRELELLDATDLADRIKGRHGDLRIGRGNAPRLVRALDHLRNAHPQQFDDVELNEQHRPLFEARDQLLTRYPTAPLTYRLRSWELDGNDAIFWSYSGPYEEGDRLVTPGGHAWRVLEAVREATKIDNGVLVVESWRQ